MASRGCKRRQIVKLDIKRCGRSHKRWCPVATINKADRRADIRTKGGGLLRDGGKRVLGGYASKSEASKKGHAWVSKHNGTTC